MANRKTLGALFGVTGVLALNGKMLSAQEKAAPGTAQVHVVITDVALRSESELDRNRRLCHRQKSIQQMN